MSEEPEPNSTSTILSLALGAVMIGLAVWMAMGGGLFSLSPEPTKTAATAELAKASATEYALGSPVSGGATPAAESAPDDSLMAEITGKLAEASAVPNEALLTFHSPSALTRFLKLAKGYGLNVVSTLDKLNAVRVRFTSSAKLRDYLAVGGADKPSLEANHWLTVPRLAKPDSANQGGAQPSGENYLKAINAVGDRSDWGHGVTVAVLDTGVKPHPTFGSDQVTHLDLVNDGTAFHSHGTSVASLIAGQDDQVPGVSPAASLLDIRVANDKGMSVTSVLSQGIIEATNRGAKVINISLGGYGDSTLLREAVNYATQRHVIVVAAAGNEKYDQLAYPAGIKGVVGVASVDATNKQAFFSNSGDVTIAAPGVGLPVAWDADKMASASGTSQSAGVVSGVIAYYLARGLSAEETLRQMKANAKATGAPPNQVGSGVVQVGK